MRFPTLACVGVVSTTCIISYPQGTVALQPEDVNRIAQQITVRIDGEDTGSGTIIKCANNTYQVLTNWHVLRKMGKYTVRTADGQQYAIDYPNRVKKHPNLDLALFEFTSTTSCRESLLSQKNVEVGNRVYAAGWANPVLGRGSRSYRFVSGEVAEFRSVQGYSLVLTNEVKRGMSGGPLLDGSGQVVGITGFLLQDPQGPITDALAIPIALFNVNEFISIPKGPPSGTPPPRTPTPTSTLSSLPPPRCPEQRLGQRRLRTARTLDQTTVRLNNIYVFRSGIFEVNLVVENRSDRGFRFSGSEIKVINNKNQVIRAGVTPVASAGTILVQPGKTHNLSLTVFQCWKEGSFQNLRLQLNEKDTGRRQFEISF